MIHTTISRLAGIGRHRQEIAPTTATRLPATFADIAGRAIAQLNRRRAAYTDTDIPERVRRDIGRHCGE